MRRRSPSVLLEGGHGVEVVTTADAAAGAAAVPRALGLAQPARAAPPPRGRARGARVRLAAPTASTRRPWCAAPRSGRRSHGGRSSSSSSPTRRTSASGARAGSTARSRSSRSVAAGSASRVLRATRTAALRRARRVVVPSAYLREIALGWGLAPDRVTVVPNPAPELPRAAVARGGARRARRPTGSRSAPQGASPPRRRSATRSRPSRGSTASSCSSWATDRSGRGLERHAAALGIADRVRFLGAGTRDDVLALFRAVDVGLLTSAWENLPHTLLEALAVGTPVIATAVGGIPEVVVDGENGVLVPAGDVAAIAAAIDRLRTDADLRGALAASGGTLGRGALRAAYPPADRAGGRGRGRRVKPRVLMVGRTRYRLPLNESLARKFGALGERLDLRVLAAAPRGASGGRRHLRPPAGHPGRRARRTGVLRLAAGPHRAGAPARARRRDPRAEPLRGARGVRRTHARAKRRRRRGRDPRRLAHLVTSLRVARAGDRRAARGSRCARRDPRGGRRPHALAVHDGHRPRGGRRAGGGVHHLHRADGVLGAARRAAPRRARRPVHRRRWSDTRTSMRSQRRGASPRRACPMRRSGSSATAVTATSWRRSSATFPAASRGIGDSRRPTW